MAKKEIKKNEFRKNRETSHPTYIYAKVGKEFKCIGLTHAKMTSGIKNIPLEKNPNPKDSRKAYARPTPVRKHISSFGKKLDGWFFSDVDKEKIKKIKK